MGGRKQLTTNEFIEKAKRVHGDRYIYDKTKYTTSQAYVILTCRIHGDFKQVARSHYAGRGNGSDCYHCSLITRRRVKSKKSLQKKYANIIQPLDYKIIPLSKGFVAIVDNEWFDRIKVHNWYLANGYAYNRKVGYMHSFIKGRPKDNLETDHIDQNKLNNRESNLRHCTRSFNAQNCKKESTSGYTGVHVWWEPGLWACRIQKNKKVEFIGLFSNEIEAAKAYDKRALEIYGENAHLNFPENP